MGAPRHAAVATLLLAVLAVLVTGCSGDGDQPVPPSPDPSGTGPTVAASAPERVRLVRGAFDRLPRASVDVPARVSADGADLPALLDDLPGRATVAYHPPEDWQAGDPTGWASEEVHLAGADGTWRVLELEDLGLPESRWPGPDTFGSGVLVSGGRRWVARVDGGLAVLDLRTGRPEVVDLPVGAGAPSQPVPVHGRDAVAVGTYVGTRYHAFEVSFSGGGSAVERVPYVAWRTAFEPDGTPVSLAYGAGPRVVSWEGGTRRVRAEVPAALGLGRRPVGIEAGEDSLVLTRPAATGRVELLAVDGTTLALRSVLRADPGQLQQALGFHDPSTFLVQTPDGVVGWDPDRGGLARVVDVPRTGPGYWSIDVLPA